MFIFGEFPVIAGAGHVEPLPVGRRLGGGLGGAGAQHLAFLFRRAQTIVLHHETIDQGHSLCARHVQCAVARRVGMPFMIASLHGRAIEPDHTIVDKC
jgi:hypothetical protein